MTESDQARYSTYNETVFNQKFACLFCPEKFSSSKMLSEHLMICGNKTDRCPNCKQFVRKAIFAYHYEHNCANLDEFTESKPITTSTVTTVAENREREKLQTIQSMIIGLFFRFENILYRNPSHCSMWFL